MVAVHRAIVFLVKDPDSVYFVVCIYSGAVLHTLFACTAFMLSRSPAESERQVSRPGILCGGACSRYHPDCL